jgi:tetratricopeptide (TPR) repeat protein
VAQFPEQPALLETLAELYESAGQTDQALQAAQHALRAGHSLPQDNHFMEHARIHNLLGRLMRHAGQLDQAVGHLNEAIQLAPDFIEPYLELGQTHLDRRQYQEAIQVYLQAIQAEPDSANTYYHAGLAYKQCKDYVSAEQMLRQAAKMSPDDLTIQRQLGAVVALNLVHNRKP